MSCATWLWVWPELMFGVTYGPDCGEDVRLACCPWQIGGDWSAALARIQQKSFFFSTLFCKQLVKQQVMCSESHADQCADSPKLFTPVSNSGPLTLPTTLCTQAIKLKWGKKVPVQKLSPSHPSAIHLLFFTHSNICISLGLDWQTNKSYLIMYSPCHQLTLKMTENNMCGCFDASHIIGYDVFTREHFMGSGVRFCCQTHYPSILSFIFTQHEK